MTKKYNTYLRVIYPPIKKSKTLKAFDMENCIVAFKCTNISVKVFRLRVQTCFNKIRKVEPDVV